MKKSNLTFLVLGIAMSFLTAFAGPVRALPNGGQITGGSGAIQNPSSNSMVIQQNSNKMITNWQQFNIGAAESVQFIQPGSGSVALNRVMGGNASSIMGSLTANGQVFLANPSGIFFGPGAQVNVGGLIATTLGISDQDFMDGNYRFTQDPARPLASIINAGEIQAGYVGLLAPAVHNHGTITANMGSVSEWHEHCHRKTCVGESSLPPPRNRPWRRPRSAARRKPSSTRWWTATATSTRRFLPSRSTTSRTPAIRGRW